MSDTDVTDVAHAAANLKIEGPHATPGSISLNDEDPYTVRPDELDPLVGANPVPAMRVASSDVIAGSGEATAHVVGNTTVAPPPNTTVTITEASPPGIVLEVVEEDNARGIRRVDAPALFDADQFTSDLPRIDGHPADKLVIAFSGSVELSRNDDNDLALFNSLRLGKNVELRVAGHVATKQGGYKATWSQTDGEGEVVTGKTGVKVDSVWLLTPEDL